MNDKIRRFVSERRPETPFLVVDTEIVEDNWRALRAALPDAEVFYAVKANPAPEVLEFLAGLGAGFDAASLEEVEAVLAVGVDPARISYGSTIKKARHIRAAYERGVRVFAFDSPAELDKLAAEAPGSHVFCRLQADGAGSDWPLGRKFGCGPREAEDLLVAAEERGLVAWGVSFHVGSQQRDPLRWDTAVAAAARVFERLRERGVNVEMVNLGGGFPCPEPDTVPPVEAYGGAIRESLFRHFGNRQPRTMVEPGRGLVANAGVIHCEVVLIARRPGPDSRRWVYLDVGKFGGLAETEGEAIRYALHTDRTGPPESVVLAGPTCDSVDVMYERSDVRLPRDLEIGDTIEIRSTGAYTATYSSVGFNGFAPLREYYI